MVSAFGADWRMRFDAFEDHAFAAASIGQARHGTAQRDTPKLGSCSELWATGAHPMDPRQTGTHRRR